MKSITENTLTCTWLISYSKQKNWPIHLVDQRNAVSFARDCPKNRVSHNMWLAVQQTVVNYRSDVLHRRL